MPYTSNSKFYGFTICAAVYNDHHIMRFQRYLLETKLGKFITFLFPLIIEWKIIYVFDERIYI